jgi:hypothetical protein
VPFDRADIARRAAALAVAGGCLAILVVAFLLSPSGEGHGTHTQIGLPSCGWVVAFDTPCPTCGMTTAYTHAVRADFLTAATTQPMGTLLAVLTAAGVVGGVHASATGCRLGRFVDTILSARTLWIALALAGGAWIYKLLTWA